MFPVKRLEKMHEELERYYLHVIIYKLLLIQKQIQTTYTLQINCQRICQN